MKATECLNVEHGVFLTQLEVLERMLQAKASSESLRAVTLAVAAAVEKHRDLEERLLYPAILKAFGPGFPPIQVMEAEHKEIESCITAIASRDVNTPSLVQAFIDILREHIHKEIRILFPMAEQRIPAGELAEMACQCAHAAGSEQAPNGDGPPLCGH